MNKFSELTVMFGNVKSYYGKALLEYCDDYVYLYSYGKKVAYVGVGWYGILLEESDWSLTTQRHINELLQQWGHEPLNKKQLLSMT